MAGTRAPFCVICSAGGHLSEALTAIEKIEGDVCFITKRDDHVAGRLAGKRMYYINDPHTSLVGYLCNVIRALYLVLVTRPRVVLSTGSGIAIPYCLLAKLLGAKLVFIETGARVTTPSRTGKFLYKYADVFYVQWPKLLEHYPRAKYEGRLI